MNVKTNEFQHLKKLSIPLILTQLGQVVVAVADNAMVGQVSSKYLASASFANNIFILIMLFGMGITLGITPIVGQLNGANNHEGMAKLLSNAFFTKIKTTVILVSVAALVYFCMPFMGQPDAVAKFASSYFILLVLSLIPLLLFFVFKQFAEGLGDTKLAMRITIVGNLLNVILNYIFIFGKFGAPALHLNGAGLATLVSRVVMLLMIIWGYKRSTILRPWLKTISTKNYSQPESRKLLKIGIPISLQMTAEASIFSLCGIMAGWLGANSLAAFQITVTISYCSFMIANGFAQAVTIHISTLLGAKAYSRVKATIVSSIKTILVIMLVMSAIFIIFRTPLTRFFTSDIKVLTIAARLMLLLVFYQISDGLQVLGMGILRGFTDVKYPMVVAIISYILVALPGGYLLGFTLGYDVYGVWMGLAIGLGLATIFFGFRVYKHIKDINKNELISQ